MNVGATTQYGFRLKALLSDDGRRVSYLAQGVGRGKRGRYVLKLFEPEPPGCDLAGTLRHDVAEMHSLVHPALASLVQLGMDADARRPFTVRSHIPGNDLLASAQGTSPHQLLPWFIAAAEALEILHRFGILHRNLKASNFRVPRSALPVSPQHRVRLILCDPAWWPESQDRRLGRADLAPERLRGEPATFASDLFALGRIFYRLLTGREAPAGTDAFPSTAVETNRQVPRDVNRVVMKLLNPEPARRYQETRVLAADLRRLCGAKVPPRLPPPECFVGRAAELARALDVLEQTASGFLAVAGETGAGKSSFLRRLGVELQRRGTPTISAQCYPIKGEILSPLEALIEQLQKLAVVRAQSIPFLRQSVTRIRATPQEYRVALRRLVTHLGSAMNRPIVLMLDDVQLADRMTIEFLRTLVREWLLDDSRGSTPTESRPRVVVAYANESPFHPALRPLLELLEHSTARQSVLELRTLDAESVDQWLELTLAEHPESSRELREKVLPHGNPLLVAEGVRSAALRRELPGPSRHRFSSWYQEYVDALEPEQREVILSLVLLGRPATTELLARTVSRTRSAVSKSLEGLLHEGTIQEDEGGYFVRQGSFCRWLEQSIPDEERAARHHALAEALAPDKNAAVDEVVEQRLRAGDIRDHLEEFREAARILERRNEPRRALTLYKAVLGSQPASPLDRVIRWEMAACHSRVGQHRQSLALLEELLPTTDDPFECGKLHAHLGMYAHRAGEVTRATGFLRRGLRLLEKKNVSGALRERLRVASELAEIASNQSDYTEAEHICRRALDEVSEVPEPCREDEVRRAEMVLLETLAHLRLRRFQYNEAEDLFERSLRISDQVAAAHEKTLILNNLGILHNQRNRFGKAIECYHRGEKMAVELGDDLTLVNILSNLALLYAKTGRVEDADEAIRRAARHGARCDSDRARFLRLHCSALVDMFLGRYASAVKTLKDAVGLGEELKDFFLTAFDLAYLGECHILRGETKAAESAFDRARNLDSPVPAPVASMIHARRATLSALRGEREDAAAAIAAWQSSGGSRIEYVDAWDRLYIGWAERLLQNEGRAYEELEAAHAFFKSARVPTGEVHAHLELIALDMDSHREARAKKRIRQLKSRYTCGRGPLRNPMLSARLLTCETRFLLMDKATRSDEAMSRVVEAESYLIGRRFRDIEAQVRDLRQQLRLRSSSAGSPNVLQDAPRDEIAASFDIVDSLSSAASDLVTRFEQKLPAEDTGTLRRFLEEFQDHTRNLARTLEGSRPPATLPFRVTSIVGASEAIRQLLRQIKRVAATDLAVLVTGETGTGKELVARAIHGEGPRKDLPFTTISCAALPEELVEAELFGFRAGAFTGAEKDTEGLLATTAGGTFFLDEVAELPLTLQAKLLRVLDQGKMRAVGSTDDVAIDVRVITATNENLRELVEAGRFRQDLFFRIAGLEIDVPPLRERLEDLPSLVDYFRSLSARTDEAPVFDEGALRVLANHSWPGNVRELLNAVTRLMITSKGTVREEDVQRVLQKHPSPGLFTSSLLRGRPLPELLAELERAYLVQLHADKGGNLKTVARTLGISLQALYKKFANLGLRPRDLRKGPGGVG